MWEATTAYNDLALALFLGAAVYALLLYERENQTYWLVIAGLCLGFGLAIKHLALLSFYADHRRVFDPAVDPKAGCESDCKPCPDIGIVSLDSIDPPGIYAVG